MKLKFMLTFGVVLSILVAIIACAKPAPLPQAQKPEVIIYQMICDITGFYAVSVGHVNYGYGDVEEYINTELGGIRGVPFKIQVDDCTGVVEKAVAAYTRAYESTPRPLVYGSQISSVGEALHAKWVEDEVVAVQSAAPAAFYPLPTNAFGTWPLYTDLFAGCVDWIAKEWKRTNNWPAEKPVKLGLLTWDNSFGRAFISDESFAHARKNGIEIIEPTEFFGLGAPSCATQLRRLRDANADWVFSMVTAGGFFVIKDSMNEIGWQPNWVSAEVRESPKLSGVYSLNAFVSNKYAGDPDPKYKGITYITEVFDRKMGDGRDPARDKTFCWKAAWSHSLLLHDAISKTVDRIGWDKLDSLAIKDQLATGYDHWLDPLGLTMYSYTAERPTPTNGIMAKVDEKGDLIHLTDYLDLPDVRGSKYR